MRIRKVLFICRVESDEEERKREVCRVRRNRVRMDGNVGIGG